MLSDYDDLLEAAKEALPGDVLRVPPDRIIALVQENARLVRKARILTDRGNHVAECLVLHYEKEKAEAQLAQAERVVAASRIVRDLDDKLDEALASYDKQKEGK